MKTPQKNQCRAEIRHPEPTVTLLDLYFLLLEFGVDVDERDATGLFLTLLACGASPHAHDSASVFHPCCTRQSFRSRSTPSRGWLQAGGYRFCWSGSGQSWRVARTGIRRRWYVARSHTDAKEQPDWIRPRVIEIVMGLQSLRISALAIVMARGFALYIPFAIVWKLLCLW